MAQSTGRGSEARMENIPLSGMVLVRSGFVDGVKGISLRCERICGHLGEGASKSTPMRSWNEDIFQRGKETPTPRLLDLGRFRGVVCAWSKREGEGSFGRKAKGKALANAPELRDTEQAVYPRDLSVPSTRMEKEDGETDKSSESVRRSEKVSLHAAASWGRPVSRSTC